MWKWKYRNVNVNIQRGASLQVKSICMDVSAESNYGKTNVIMLLKKRVTKYQINPWVCILVIKTGNLIIFCDISGLTNMSPRKLRWNKYNIQDTIIPKYINSVGAQTNVDFLPFCACFGRINLIQTLLSILHCPKMPTKRRSNYVHSVYWCNNIRNNNGYIKTTNILPRNKKGRDLLH